MNASENVIFLETKAKKLAKDQNYYNNIYVSLVLDFNNKFKDFYSKNLSIIKGWINGKEYQKLSKILFLVDFVKTITILNNSIVPDKDRLANFVKCKNKNESEKIDKEVLELNEDFKNKSKKNLLSQDDFLNLFKQSQILLSFIKELDFREIVILENLKVIQNEENDEVINSFYLNNMKIFSGKNNQYV